MTAIILPVTELRTAHTADLDPAELAIAHALVAGAFDRDDFSADDWEHALGGIHALAWEGDELIGHAAVVQRRLLHGGQALRTGYVEAMAVRADRRRRGVAGALMAAAERIIRGAYDLGALGATDAAIPLYAARGWLRWEGPTFALTPGGVVRTEDDDGGVYVLRVSVDLDIRRELTCDWRDGDVW